MLKFVETETAESDIETSAERFKKLFADAAAQDITFADECALHAAFLDAAMAHDATRCRMIADELATRVDTMRASQQREELARQPDQRIAELRLEFERLLGDAAPSFAPLVSFYQERFLEAEVAQDVLMCRAIVTAVSDAHDYRTAEEIEAEQKQAALAHLKKFAEVQANAAEARRRAQALERLGNGGAFIAAEKLGVLKLGANEEVLYSGPPLDADVLAALEADARNVRITLRQRWQDRMIAPAPRETGAGESGVRARQKRTAR